MLEDLNLRRTQAAINLEQPDQVPLELLLEGDFISHFVGLREREYFLNPKKMLNAQLLVKKRFSKKNNFFNINTLPYADLSIATEPSVLGCTIRWSEDSTPWPIPIIKDPEDVDRLDEEGIDPSRDGMMPYVIETIEYMQEKVGDDHLVQAPWPRGAVCLASLVRGINEFMVDIHVNPDLAHKLLRICTRVIIECTRIFEETVGEGFFIRVGDDMAGFLSLEDFREFALPYNRQIFKKFPHNSLFHCDADTHQLLDAIPELGAKIFNPGPPETCDIGDAKMKIGDTVCLMGNIAPYDVIASGNPEDIESAVRACIQKAGKGGGYIFAPGGVIPRGTPPRNIDILINAVEKYGKYPIK